VPRVGEQCERVSDHPGRDLRDHHGHDDRQRSAERATIRVESMVVSAVHGAG